MKRTAARWSMSLLLWATTFGRREAVLKRLEAEFVGWFRHHVTAFPVVRARLTAYLDQSTDADVWLITGSPRSAGGAGLSRYPLVAAGESDSQPHRARRWGGWVLTLRAAWGMKRWFQLEKDWRPAAAGHIAAIAIVSRIIHCSAFASIAGG